MSVNTNSQNSQGSSASAKHRGRNAEGSVRVLGQTAAVAGISGALLLALKAMVLVSPAVLPDSDGLDALGRPNAIVENTDQVAPVTFTPAANPISVAPSGRSERIIERTVTTPVTTTKPAKPADTTTTPGTTTPDKPAITVGAKPDSTVGKVTKPVTDVVDGLLGTELGGTVDAVGGTVDGVVDTVNGTTGNVLKPVTDTLGVGSSKEAEKGLVPQLGDTLGSAVGGVTGGLTGGSTTSGGGLLGGLLGGKK